MANDAQNMKSLSEKTHAKNHEYTHIFNSIVAGIGAAWKPNKPLIAADALIEFETGSVDFMQAFNTAVSNEQAKIGAQIATFRMGSKEVGKIIKTAAGRGLSAEYRANLRLISNRLNSVRVK